MEREQLYTLVEAGRRKDIIDLLAVSHHTPELIEQWNFLLKGYLTCKSTDLCSYAFSNGLMNPDLLPLLKRKNAVAYSGTPDPSKFRPIPKEETEKYLEMLAYRQYWEKKLLEGLEEFPVVWLLQEFV